MKGIMAGQGAKNKRQMSFSSKQDISAISPVMAHRTQIENVRGKRQGKEMPNAVF